MWTLNQAERQFREADGQHALWEGQIFTMKDAYTPRAPLAFAVSGLFPLPSLSIFYGAPGTLKSILLAYFAGCVSSNKNCLNRDVTQSPVLWIEADNGRRRTHERFAAIGRALDLTEDAPLYYVSMPTPWLNAGSDQQICDLINRVKELGVKFICIDNLGLISGGADENSDDMITVMSNLRYVAEETGAAVVVIHHQRKGINNGRAGEQLRGHSSIEGAIDLALHVKREENSNVVMLSSTKTRDVDVEHFGAEFRYEHKPGTTELLEACFVPFEVEDVSSERAIEAVLIDIMKNNNDFTQKEAVTAAKEKLRAGVNHIRCVWNRLKNAGAFQDD